MRNFKKFLALVLAMMMVVGGMVTVSAAEETVAAEYDYTAAAEALADLGIVKGTSDDVIDFALEDKVVRYQMALLVARIMTGEVDDTYWNKVVENTTPFDDVTKYYGAIAYVADNEIVEGKGWIPGVGDNCFDPEGAITYEQALTMAVRALGYKQLVYPTGFVNTAKELGLTDGLEELAGDTQLTRGQMFQIIYNLFFTAGKDGKDFATKAFGLETKSYVVVATENQALAGADRVYRVDYEGKTEWDKYVALAPINADGTYDLKSIIHLTEGELGMSFRESEYRIGYSYTVLSFDGFKTAYDAFQNDTKTFQNYGDVKTEIAAGNKYHGQADNLILLDGVTYKMVNTYTDLNNKDSYANRQPELIIHSMFSKSAVVESGALYYDALGNIVDPTKTTDNILIYYVNGGYYVKEANGYFRVATDADFAAAAQKVSTTTVQYGITTSASDLVNDIAFCEITLFDDNNDGAWDRGLYIPYSMGKYSTITTSAFVVSSSKVVKDQTVATVNGSAVGATVQWEDQHWGATTAIRQSDIHFIGAGRPSKDTYIVYYYNPEGRVFNVIEKAAVKTAKVTAVNQGTYSYDANINNELGTKGAYFWKNATVTLEGEAAPLVMGYRDYQTKKQIGTDLLYIDAQIARYGYDQAAYNALLNSSFMNLQYVVLANRIVYAAEKDTRAVAGQWLAFDYGTESTNANTGTTGFTTYGYEGDIIGVDADGNILVNAYVQGKKEQIVAAIGSINGFDTFGELVADYAALNFNFSGIGILGNEQYETMQKIVIRRFFDTLTKDLGVDAEGEELRQMMYTVTDYEDGVYGIYTDIDLYWGADGNQWRQPKALYKNLTSVITIHNGVADGYFGTSSSVTAYNYLKFNKDSKIIVIGKDGIKTATGIPTAKEGNPQIKFSAASVNALYAYSADLVVIAAPYANCADVYTGVFDDQSSAGGYTYYLVTGSTAVDKLDDYSKGTVVWDANGVATYTYFLWNITKGTSETVTVTGGLPKFQAESIFNFNVAVPVGAIYAEKNGKWALVNDVVEGSVATGNVITKVKYAPEARQDLIDIMYNGKPGYAPVFANRGISQGGQYNSGSIWNNYLWKYKNDEGKVVEIREYDLAIGKQLDQYMVKYDANNMLVSVTVSDSSTAIQHSAFVNKTGSNGLPCYTYFNYVPGTSFLAAYVYNDGNDTGYCSPAEQAIKDAAALAAAKTAAIAEVDALTPVVADALAKAKTDIDAATTIDAVTVAVDTYKAAVEAAKGAAATEDQKWADLKAGYDAIAADATTYGSAPCATFTIKAVYDSWYAEVVAKRNYDEAVKTLETLETAIAAAAEAARPTYVVIEGDKFTFKNAKEFKTGNDGITIHALDANGKATKILTLPGFLLATNATNMTIKQDGYTASFNHSSATGIGVLDFYVKDSLGQDWTAFAAGKYVIKANINGVEIVEEFTIAE